MVRLELYVDSYGLTHWRIAALIWMVLVAVGLCALWFHIWKDQSNSWMVLRIGVFGGIILYSCAFISFDRVIAQYNLTHEVRLDRHYLCNLGEAALPEIQRQTGRTAESFCWDVYVYDNQQTFMPRDWREWGFRNWRVRRSLSALTQAVMIP